MLLHVLLYREAGERFALFDLNTSFSDLRCGLPFSGVSWASIQDASPSPIVWRAVRRAYGP